MGEGELAVLHISHLSNACRVHSSPSQSRNIPMQQMELSIGQAGKRRVLLVRYVAGMGYGVRGREVVVLLVMRRRLIA